MCSQLWKAVMTLSMSFFTYICPHGTTWLPLDECEINIGKQQCRRPPLFWGEDKRICKFCGLICETECSSVNSDCVTVCFSRPLVSPLLAGMCRKKKQVKKSGRKSQKFNQPRLQTLIALIAIVNSLAMQCS